MGKRLGISTMVHANARRVKPMPNFYRPTRKHRKVIDIGALITRPKRLKPLINISLDRLRRSTNPPPPLEAIKQERVNPSANPYAADEHTRLRIMTPREPRVKLERSVAEFLTGLAKPDPPKVMAQREETSLPALEDDHHHE